MRNLSCDLEPMKTAVATAQGWQSADLRAMWPWASLIWVSIIQENDWVATQPWNSMNECKDILNRYPYSYFKMNSHMCCLSDACPVQGHFSSFLVPAPSRAMGQGQHGTFCKCGLGIDLFQPLCCSQSGRRMAAGCINSWFKCLRWHWFELRLHEDYFNRCHHLSFFTGHYHFMMMLMN